MINRMATKRKVDDLVVDKECPVCYRDDISTYLQLGCGHSFCYDCILNWTYLENKLDCPMCRAPICTTDFERPEVYCTVNHLWESVHHTSIDFKHLVYEMIEQYIVSCDIFDENVCRNMERFVAYYYHIVDTYYTPYTLLNRKAYVNLITQNLKKTNYMFINHCTCKDFRRIIDGCTGHGKTAIISVPHDKVKYSNTKMWWKLNYTTDRHWPQL